MREPGWLAFIDGFMWFYIEDKTDDILHYIICTKLSV